MATFRYRSSKASNSCTGKSLTACQRFVIVAFAAATLIVAAASLVLLLRHDSFVVVSGSPATGTLQYSCHQHLCNDTAIAPPSSGHKAHDGTKHHHHTESNPQQKSDTTKDDFLLQCLRTILDGDQLPIGRPGSRYANVVRAHHYDARRLDMWNADIRLKPIPQLATSSQAGIGDTNINDTSVHCSVWEVGAHVKADDTAALLKLYPHCYYHAYEPVEEFATKLQQRWQKYQPRVTIHSYGIGDVAHEYRIPRIQLAEQSTYPEDGKGGAASSHSHETYAVDPLSASTTPVRIVSFETALNDADGYVPTVLHLNCEGCEWDLLPQAYEAKLLQQIPVIQVGTHNYGTNIGLSRRIWQLCEIRYLLQQTHDMVDGIAFAWERWVLRE